MISDSAGLKAYINTQIEEIDKLYLEAMTTQEKIKLMMEKTYLIERLDSALRLEHLQGKDSKDATESLSRRKQRKVPIGVSVNAIEE